VARALRRAHLTHGASRLPALADSSALPAVLLVAAILFYILYRAGPSAAAGQVLDEQYSSRALDGTVHYAVYLPPGYKTSTRRYPVVYALHGLPASPTSYTGIADFLRDALERRHLRAIVVAPQGARTDDPDPEYLDLGPGRNWATALSQELPRIVDEHFKTIPTRRGRAIVGISAGGYGAMLLGIHHLTTFSAVESWSGYFHPTDPSGWHALDLHSAAKNAHASAHAAVPTLRKRLKAHPAFVGFYVGDADDRFRDENVRFNKELSAAHVPHVFRVYRGGHEQSLWSSRASEWLELALDHLGG